MSLNIGDNFKYLGKKFLDARESFDTLEEMNACTGIPEGFITYCKEDKKRYEYNGTTWVEYTGGVGMTDEEREQLSTKFDDVTAETITDENESKLTQLTFYSNGTEMKSVQFKGSNDEANINMDDIVYYGKEEPTNDNVIWFVPDSAMQSEVTYDNPIIMELMGIIRNMQSQIAQLQADVEYLKTHGGGSGGSGGTVKPPDPEKPTPSNYSYLILEDGSKLLFEDGSKMLLEEQQAVAPSNYSYLILEDGSKLLFEDGSKMLLEEQNIIKDSSYLLLESREKLLFENGSKMLLEA